MSNPTQTYVAPTLRASGSAFSDLQNGGLTALIKQLEAANAAIANATTAPTFAATGGGATGGALPAGNYFGVYTWTNGFGETLASTESAQLTVGATNIPRATLPSKPTGATGANLYMTVAGGASGTEKLYKAGITTTTFDLAVAVFEDSSIAPPTVNTTAMSSIAGKIEAGITLRDGPFYQYLHAAQLLSNYVAGKPVALSDLLQRLARASAVFKGLGQLLDEAGVLCAANPGTFGAVTNAITSTPVRTFP